MGRLIPAYNLMEEKTIKPEVTGEMPRSVQEDQIKHALVPGDCVNHLVMVITFSMTRHLSPME
jgi:hypothetical protein